MSDNTRAGDWMQTFSGRKFWAMDPRPEDVCIEDIGHALSLMCRFNGHVREYYSVAEHSVRVSRLAEGSGLELAALLHDAAEAYVVDVPRPLKRFLVGYKEIEARVARAVEVHFGLPLNATEHEIVKHLDEVLLATEARDLMGGESAGKWSLRAAPLADIIFPMSSTEAHAAFMTRYREIVGR